MEGISTVITPGTAAACILAIIIGYVYTKEERRAMQGLAVSQAAQEQSPLDLGDLSRAEALAKVIPDYESTKNDLTRIEYPERPLHVVLIATGSVASVKIPLMVKDLLQVNRILIFALTELTVVLYSIEMRWRRLLPRRPAFASSIASSFRERTLV